MRKVRIEEVTVGASQGFEFSQNIWLESETLQYSDIVFYQGENWIVVELEGVDPTACSECKGQTYVMKDLFGEPTKGRCQACCPSDIYEKYDELGG